MLSANQVQARGLVDAVLDQDKLIDEACKLLKKTNGWPLQPDQPVDGIDVRRLLLIMVNEAAGCLENGVVESAAGVDTGRVFGTGFPTFGGGLCRWADHEGIKLLARELRELANKHVHASPRQVT